MSLRSPSDAIPTGNVYEKYETKNRIERAIVSRFLRRLDGSLPAEIPETILEVGAGEGEIALRVRRRFPEARVVAIDLPDEGIARHWQEKRLCGAFADAVRLPVRDKIADLVLAIEVLEHLPDPDAALKEIARVARDRVVLSVPLEPLWRLGNLARGRYWRAWGNTPGHIQHWSTRALVRLASKHLQVLAVYRPLPWTMVIARVRGADT